MDKNSTFFDGMLFEVLGQNILIYYMAWKRPAPGLHVCNVPNREPKSWRHFQARCCSTSFRNSMESLIESLISLHSSMSVFYSTCY